MLIRKISNIDLPAILKIAESLPQWFTASGLESVESDLPFQSGFVAVEHDHVIGFITFFVNQGSATIGWMGIAPSHHRNGIGRALLAELRSYLKTFKIKSILVSTLSDAVEYEPYGRTRAFYRSNGFFDLQRIEHPENPEYEEELILKCNL